MPPAGPTYGQASTSNSYGSELPRIGHASGYSANNGTISIPPPSSPPQPASPPNASTSHSHLDPQPISHSHANHQFPRTGDLAASPWTHAQNVPAHSNFQPTSGINSQPTHLVTFSQDVNHRGPQVPHGTGFQGGLNAANATNGPDIQLNTAQPPVQYSQQAQYSQQTGAPNLSSPSHPVATLQWGMIHQAIPHVSPNAATTSGEMNLIDSRMPSLGAPIPVPNQPGPRSVVSHPVSSASELNLGPAYPNQESPAAFGSAPGAEPAGFGMDNAQVSPSLDAMYANGFANGGSNSGIGGHASPNMPSVPYYASAPNIPMHSAVAPAPDPRWLAEQEALERRRALAEKVSNEILASAPQPAPATIAPLEMPAGWNSVEQDLRVHMEKCEQLLRKNAIHSARDEVALGLRRLCRMLDAMSGAPRCENSLDSALTALKEEAEFQRAEGIVSIQDLVASHSTPALKNGNLKEVTAETAAQHYRHYARQQFVQASDQHPWAADLLYAFGKTLEKEADSSFDSSMRLRSQAVICYQAALQIRQGHPSASSQLGYSLLKLDRLDEAYHVLSQAVQSSPSSSNWTNLAEVYRRRGSNQHAQYALAQASAFLAPAPEGYSEDNPEVTQVDAAEFAKYSPALNMVAPVATSVQQSAKPAEPAKTANIFSNLFR